MPSSLNNNGESLMWGHSENGLRSYKIFDRSGVEVLSSGLPEESLGGLHPNVMMYALNDSRYTVGRSTNSDALFASPQGSIYSFNGPMYWSEAVDINNSLEVVGTLGVYSTDSPRPFIFRGLPSQYQLIPVPANSPTSHAKALNEDGIVVGRYSNTQYQKRGFVWTGGSSVLKVRHLDLGDVILSDINNHNLILGYGIDPSDGQKRIIRMNLPAASGNYLLTDGELISHSNLNSLTDRAPIFTGWNCS